MGGLTASVAPPSGICDHHGVCSGRCDVSGRSSMAGNLPMKHLVHELGLFAQWVTVELVLALEPVHEYNDWR